MEEQRQDTTQEAQAEKQAADQARQDTSREELIRRLDELASSVASWRHAATSTLDSLRMLWSVFEQASQASKESDQKAAPEVGEDFDPFDEESRKSLIRAVRAHDRYAQELQSLRSELSRVSEMVPLATSLAVSIARELFLLSREDPDLLGDEKALESLVKTMVDRNIDSLRKAYELVYADKLTKKKEEALRKKIEEEVRKEMLSGAVRTGSTQAVSRYAQPQMTAAKFGEYIAQRLK